MKKNDESFYMNQLISIIIPVKNGENYLAEALEGIKKQNMNVEIIVVDDGSTDSTVEIAEKYNCKIVKHEKCLGQVAGKNSGLKIAAGEFIMFHDHDDLLENGALEIMFNEFKEDNDLMVVNAKVKDFISPDAKNKKQMIKAEPYFGCLAGSLLIKKKVFDLIVFFDESVQTGELLDLTAKFKKYTIKVKKIEFVSSYRRIHDTNHGKINKGNEFKDYALLSRGKLKR